VRSLDEYSTLELHSELRRRKEAAPTNPIDYWWVATEIGVEGARLERFGKYYGHFAEVALRFADKVGYGLYLNRARILSDLPPLPPSWTALFDDPKQIFCGHHKVTIATEKTGILDQEFFPVIGLPK